MLTVEMSAAVGQEQLRKRIICLFCSEKITFFYRSDAECSNCGKKIPDVAGMCQEEEKRIEYHRTGTTSGKRTYFWDRDY